MVNDSIIPPDGPRTYANNIAFIGLLGMLKTKGIITDYDIDDLFDLAALGLEEAGLMDPFVKAVHVILEQTRNAVSAPGTRST